VPLLGNETRQTLNCWNENASLRTFPFTIHLSLGTMGPRDLLPRLRDISQERSHVVKNYSNKLGVPMLKDDKDDGVVQADANNSPTTSSGDGKITNDSEEQLRALVAHCEAKLDEQADLVARVRHEINNPLTGVLGQAQLLLREELSGTARKRAETIEDLAIRLRDVVAQLRDVQRSKS
jgi:signal transduction histidine kinase